MQVSGLLFLAATFGFSAALGVWATIIADHKHNYDVSCCIVAIMSGVGAITMIILAIIVSDNHWQHACRAAGGAIGTGDHECLRPGSVIHV